jgi:hypothetical protein
MPLARKLLFKEGLYPNINLILLNYRIKYSYRGMSRFRGTGGLAHRTDFSFV